MYTQTHEVYQLEFGDVPCSRAIGGTSAETDDSDVQLIERFQQGDSKVFDLLFLRYHDRIYRVIRCIIANPDDALDIMQDVFLKAYKELGDFKKAAQFYSWLYRITINRCIDFMRQRRKHRVISDNPISDDMFYDHVANRHLPAPYKAVENEEFRAYLRDADMQLSPKQREVFILRHREELPLKEIARKLGRSIGTVKAHLFHAQRNLRELLLPYLRDDRVLKWNNSKKPKVSEIRENA